MSKIVSSLNFSLIKISIFTLSIFLFYGLIGINDQTFSKAVASITLGESIGQFQHNLQESINREIQSIFQRNNFSSNCDDSNDISVQSQTNNDGKTTSTVVNSCDNLNYFNSFFSVSSSSNKSGKIVSSEYDLDTGTIINSIFGNWSLITTDNGTSFNAFFIKQPVFYDVFPSTFSGSDTIPNSTDTHMNGSERDFNNITAYQFSNFIVNSIQKQNEDITYSGKIDILQKVFSTNSSEIVESTTFTNVDASISINNDKILMINFVNDQTKLFDEFRNIPIVGIVQ
jgi:hypothetical protein